MFNATPQNNWKWEKKSHNRTVAVPNERARNEQPHTTTTKTVKISSWRRRTLVTVRPKRVMGERENVRVEMITILRVKRVFYINLFLAFQMQDRSSSSSSSSSDGDGDGVSFNATTLERIRIIRNGFCVSGVWLVHAASILCRCRCIVRSFAAHNLMDSFVRQT